MESKTGIYKITSPSGRIYIGQSIDIDKRKRQYFLNNAKKQPKLYNSLLKYGFNNHIFEIVEICLFEELNNRERYWQDYYDVLNNGLNCKLTKTEEKVTRLSEESRNKIGLRHKNKKVSLETRLKISISSKNRFVSEETKLKKNKKLKGLKRTKDTIKLMSLNNTQRKSVICLKSGKVWTSITDCAIELNLKPKTLNNKLTGFRKNNTSIRYLNNE